MTIATKDLTQSLIPNHNARIREINAFAITFAMSEVNYEMNEFGLDSDLYKLSIVQLRYLLYCEQRRWNHFGKDYDAYTENRIRLLIKILKEKVAVK